MDKEINKAHNNIKSDEIIDTHETLLILEKSYTDGLAFLSSLHDDGENLQFISEDMMKIGNYIATLGMATAMAESVLENKLSNTDKLWRSERTSDYKLSSKSSTTHQINLRGSNSNHRYNLVSKGLRRLYDDLNTKFKCLQFVGSNLKFEIEKGLAVYTINRTISK
jgi:hypothetical protein